MKVNRIKTCKFVGENIKIYRKRLGYTQKKVAEEMELSSSVTLCRWETGANMPTAENLQLLAKVLHISLEDLFADPNSEQRKRKEIKGSVYDYMQERCQRAAEVETPEKYYR